MGVERAVPVKTSTSNKSILHVNIQIRLIRIIFFFTFVRSFTTISTALKISFVKNIRVYRCPRLKYVVVYTKQDSFSDTTQMFFA